VGDSIILWAVRHLSIRVSPPSAPFPGNLNNKSDTHHHLPRLRLRLHPSIRSPRCRVPQVFFCADKRPGKPAVLVQMHHDSTTCRQCSPDRLANSRCTQTSAANHISSRKRRQYPSNLQHSNQSAAGNTPHRRFPQTRRSFRTTKIYAVLCAARSDPSPAGVGARASGRNRNSGTQPRGTPNYDHGSAAPPSPAATPTNDGHSSQLAPSVSTTFHHSVDRDAVI
jgi:hypothetical protein